MSSGITNELDDLAKSFKLYRFKNELDFYKSQNDKKYSDKIDSLTKIIAGLDGIQDVKEDSKNKIQNVFNEIDKMVYKKPWKKLPNFHKNIKIKEYVSDNFKDKKNDSDIIEKILLDAVENKELNKDEYVAYDQNLCKITSIPILKQNDDGKYILEYPTKKVTKSKKSISKN